MSGFDDDEFGSFPFIPFPVRAMPGVPLDMSPDDIQEPDNIQELDGAGFDLSAFDITHDYTTNSTEWNTGMSLTELFHASDSSIFPQPYIYAALRPAPVKKKNPFTVVVDNSQLKGNEPKRERVPGRFTVVFDNTP